MVFIKSRLRPNLVPIDWYRKQFSETRKQKWTKRVEIWRLISADWPAGATGDDGPAAERVVLGSSERRRRRQGRPRSHQPAPLPEHAQWVRHRFCSNLVFFFSFLFSLSFVLADYLQRKAWSRDSESSRKVMSCNVTFWSRLVFQWWSVMSSWDKVKRVVPNAVVVPSVT